MCTKQCKHTNIRARISALKNLRTFAYTATTRNLKRPCAVQYMYSLVGLYTTVFVLQYRLSSLYDYEYIT